MYFYSPHQPQLLTTFSYNLHLALPNQWRTKKINFRSTDPPFMTYVRAEVASVFEWLRRSIRWMVRMNKNSVGPQQRVKMRVLPACAFLCCGLIAFWSQSTFLALTKRKSVVEVFTFFCGQSWWENSEKSTRRGCDQRPHIPPRGRDVWTSERRGSDEFFWVFPPQTSTKNLIFLPFALKVPPRSI